jgi:hypothetical protein
MKSLDKGAFQNIIFLWIKDSYSYSVENTGQWGAVLLAMLLLSPLIGESFKSK